MTPLPTRREHETHELGPFTVRIGYQPWPSAPLVMAVAKALDAEMPGQPHWTHWVPAAEAAIGAVEKSRPPVIEVFFDQRDKVGTELNAFLHDAGVLISKVLQGKEVG